MCDFCVIQSVKNKMLSRRDLFRGGAAVAAATAISSAAPPALAAGHANVTDMTHMLDETFPTWGGDPGIAYDKIADFAESGFNAYKLSIGEHSGTHIDAPLHFTADGQSVDEIPVENLVCPLCVVDIRERAAGDADTMVTPDDLSAWTAANGPIPDGACIAMLSGWGAKARSPEFRNADDSGTQHYPGFHVETTEMLLETGAVAMAVDTLSLDHGASQDFATHYAWLPAGRYGIECLANLEAMPASGATLIVGAPKHGRGTGGQARIFGMV